MITPCLVAVGDVEAPRIGDSFELVLALVVEDETGAGAQVLDGPGDKDLFGLRRRRDSGRTGALPLGRLGLPVR